MMSFPDILPITSSEGTEAGSPLKGNQELKKEAFLCLVAFVINLSSITSFKLELMRITAI